MTLQQTIKDQIKKAMMAHDEKTVVVLRGIQAEVGTMLLAKPVPTPDATDEEVLAIIRKLVKQRKDSIEQFTAGGRPELADAESKELAILQAYLPVSMSKEDIKKVVEKKKAELGITDKAKMGQLIGAVSKELKGKAEGSDIKTVVEGIFA
jgi:uncharacterized protein YqeY